MSPTFNDLIIQYQHLFTEQIIAKNELFMKMNQPVKNIALITKGVMRGFVYDDKGDEINILFFKENDMVSGNLAPGLPSALNIECLEECTVRSTDFGSLSGIIQNNIDLQSHYGSYMNQTHARIQSRLTTLINCNALDRYRFFLKEYPGLVNRIPHYHIANFLGITPTQLSRIRRKFVTER
jgi:CRP/FNR family transcriptional regulator, anaerobic regulatory protein